MSFRHQYISLGKMETEEGLQSVHVDYGTFHLLFMLMATDYQVREEIMYSLEYDYFKAFRIKKKRIRLKKVKEIATVMHDLLLILENTDRSVLIQTGLIQADSYKDIASLIGGTSIQVNTDSSPINPLELPNE